MQRGPRRGEQTRTQLRGWECIGVQARPGGEVERGGERGGERGESMTCVVHGL